ncbi:RNA degradosome polyphosphate kinase [Streptosporangium sp. NBC_01755]|uniref:RNA degradosome polyphosphate kinase n=1 Tax=unclassified Streptosporangium TaxID=2632669 RepID=UPI002DDB85D6|nr:MULTISPECIES: RNA degradosome polyphosphate kinase [unclassified Streptosporangium]WSA26063.1 RNA degradosome polyphosphate kinase [Streptosporangium sp. NBC_01810]WSD02508.1 RNA degradosome polyphosphate kinase [Streptosporangium sp. NBC_01755]
MSAELAGATPAGLPLPQERFLNREESWLQFNQRVLEMAEDPSLPLLERVRFLAIFASNLDEFFRVRVAGLKRRMATGLLLRTKSGLKPREELPRIAGIANDLALRQSACFHERIRPRLSAEGIEIVRWDDLGRDERTEMRKFFRERIRPVLTPLAVDPAHPFPYISGLSLNLAVTVRNPSTGNTVFARVKVPSRLPRFVTASVNRFVPLEDVIAAHLGQLFKGMEIVEHHAFRVTRNEDLDVDEDVTENLMQALERELLKRRFGPPVRLEVEDTITPEVLDLLVDELGVAEHEICRLPGPLDLTGLHAIADLDRGELTFRPFVPAEVVHVEDDIFAVLRERDVLLHHPYDSFSTSVQRFIEQAAADPNVLAIKQTLYRTSGDSPIVDALIDAAEAGKQVVVVVEIKARFDEHANITWARKLERAGCHVVYGVVGLKTHCKLALVVRQESSGELRSYCHIGTGNYNPKTARLYEDLGLLTADRLVGEDVTDLFIHLTGYSNHSAYRRLLVAPHSLRGGLLARIEREIAHQEAGRPAGIRMKTNSLVDEPIIDALYRASRAGVPVDLWVRGVCTLRPGVQELSENIRVRSVLGRFLEHSRIYEFGRGRRPEIWIGSGDMMRRNIERRVEVLVKVASQQQRNYLSGLLDRAMSDDTTSWWLDPDGTWLRHPGDDLQTHLIGTRRWRAIDD